MRKVIIISGPTASGKSAIAHHLYETIQSSVVINADSMQLYQELPIITAQPDERISSDYKLYSTLSYQEHYSVARWLEDVKACIKQAWQDCKVPIIVGGTGLYIKALIYGLSNLPEISQATREQVATMLASMGKEDFYKSLLAKDPALQGKIFSTDTYRMTRAMEVLLESGRSMTSFYQNQPSDIEAEFVHFTLVPQRAILHQNCNIRFEMMLKEGAIEELELFFKQKNWQDSLLAKALGVKELYQYLNKLILLEEAVDLSTARTRQYAKRQLTWFRNQAPEAIIVEYEDLNYAREIILEHLNKVAKSPTSV